MKLLVIGPTRYQWGADGYGGVERLCGLLIGGLAARGHTVIALAPEGSVMDPRAVWIHVPLDSVGEYGEVEAYRVLRGMVEKRDVDFVLDLSHKHILRWKEGWPGFSWIWHDPYVDVGVKLPKDGVMCLSEWQRGRLGSAAAVCDIHMVGEAYRYSAERPLTQAWRWLGRLDRDKGPVEAARLAVEAWVPHIDFIGPTHDSAVHAELMHIMQSSHKICLWGEVSEVEKVESLLNAAGHLYTPQFPPGISEAHSMKTVEALCCGTPTVIQGRSSEPYGEVFGDMLDSFATAGNRDRAALSQQARAIWSVDATIERIEEAIHGD